VDPAALLLTACGGFLLAVLWMDLVFDVQVLRHRGRIELPDSVLASIASYYHRATTTSRPMSYLIAVVMVVLLGALGFQAVRGNDAGWSIIASADRPSRRGWRGPSFGTMPHASGAWWRSSWCGWSPPSGRRGAIGPAPSVRRRC
jgi:hypothetical protein